MKFKGLCTMIALVACAAFAASALSEAGNSLPVTTDTASIADEAVGLQPVGTYEGQLQTPQLTDARAGEIIRLVRGVQSGAKDLLIAASPGTFPGWAQDVADQIASTGKVPGDIDLFNTGIFYQNKYQVSTSRLTLFLAFLPPVFLLTLPELQLLRLELLVSKPLRLGPLL